MSRYVLVIELPEGAVLELSTGHPQPGPIRGQPLRIVDNPESRSVPIRPIAFRPFGTVGRLGASAPSAAHGEPRDLPTALSEDELIAAHGGIGDREHD